MKYEDFNKEHAWAHFFRPPFLLLRFQYEEEVKRNPLNYDNWFDYVKLEESTGDVERIREVS